MAALRWAPIIYPWRSPSKSGNLPCSPMGATHVRRIFKSRWWLLALAPVILLFALAGWLLFFSESAQINRTAFRKIKLGMTYDEVHVLLGGRIHDVSREGK
jgi:hypothetical protein